jgi:probable HAF family extracellular repeat protein
MASFLLPQSARLRCAFVSALLILPALAHARPEPDGVTPGHGQRNFTPTYAVTDLGILAGDPRTVSTDLNDLGEATGISINANDSAVLFRGGAVIDLVPTATASYASALNLQGQATGYFFDGQKWKGFLSGRSGLKSFQAPNAQATYADSLNDIGQIAGDYTDANSNDHIFVRQADGSFQDLGIFGVDPSASAINDQGRVLIGTYDTPRNHTYLSRPGSVGLEEVPSLIPNGGVSPGDMNNFGLVVGWASIDPANQNEHAYVYFQGKIKDLGVLPGGDSTWGYGINNLGQTVGAAYQAPKPIYNANGNITGYTPAIAHGWVNVAGKLRDVNQLLNAASTGWEISLARKINDRGQVLADANFQQGDVHAVLLTPNAILPPVVTLFP